MRKIKSAKIKKVLKKEKKTRRRKKKVDCHIDTSQLFDIDMVYKAVNKIQLTREPVSFKILESDAHVVDNVLKDVELKYTKKVIKSIPVRCVEYNVQPGPEMLLDRDFNDIEEFPDEILEDGQLFF